jgi:hypothetical protein
MIKAWSALDNMKAGSAFVGLAFFVGVLRIGP